MLSWGCCSAAALTLGNLGASAILGRALRKHATFSCQPGDAVSQAMQCRPTRLPRAGLGYQWRQVQVEQERDVVAHHLQRVWSHCY